MTWDLRGNTRAPGAGGGAGRRGPPGEAGRRGFRGGFRAPAVPAGEYVVVLKIGDQETKVPVTVPEGAAEPGGPGREEDGQGETH